MRTKTTDALKGFIALLVLPAQLALAGPAAGGADQRSASAETAPAVELLAACERCHGPEASQPAAPHLDGQVRGYLIDSISMLISGERPTSVENHFPAGLSRPQILGLARHYSQSRRRLEVDETDPDKVLQGEMIYMERCMACHDDYGRDTDNKGLGSPRLAGQRLDYLRAQILAYLTKRRAYWGAMKENAFAGQALAINGTPVRDAIGPLSHDDAEALANFFASVPSAAASGRRRR